MSPDDPGLRRPLFPPGVEPLQLHHRPEPLAGAIAACRAQGWFVVDLDTGAWGDRSRLHDDLAAAFGFPSYYGRNLDALDDALGGVIEGRHGIPAEAPGALIVLRRFDRFLATDERTAASIVGIFNDAAAGALRFGWPMSCILVSEDPDLSIEIGQAAPVPWNRSERTRAARIEP